MRLAVAAIFEFDSGSFYARVAKLADAPDLGSGGAILVGSSPSPSIFLKPKFQPTPDRGHGRGRLSGFAWRRPGGRDLAGAKRVKSVIILYDFNYKADNALIYLLSFL